MLMVETPPLFAVQKKPLTLLITSPPVCVKLAFWPLLPRMKLDPLTVRLPPLIRKVAAPPLSTKKSPLSVTAPPVIAKLADGWLPPTPTCSVLSVMGLAGARTCVPPPALAPRTYNAPLMLPLKVFVAAPTSRYIPVPLLFTTAPPAAK